MLREFMFWEVEGIDEHWSNKNEGYNRGCSSLQLVPKLVITVT